MLIAILAGAERGPAKVEAVLANVVAEIDKLGLVLAGCNLPLLSRAWSFESAVAIYVVQAALIALAITPSLAYMAEGTTDAGIASFGVSYGLYNLAWGLGLLCGPALAGVLFERIGFTRLTLVWAPMLAIVTVVLARVKSSVRLEPDAA